MDEQTAKPGCRLFNCDLRHGNYCCAGCDRKDKCKNHCLNSPDKCGCNVELKKKKDIKEVVE